MRIERLRLTIELALESDIAVRTGELTSEGAPASIVRDNIGAAYVPATTLKGALRSRYQGAHADYLFGVISKNANESDEEPAAQGNPDANRTISGKDVGNAGAIIFDHAFAHAESASKQRTAVLTRTAIDRKRGAPEQNKLFGSEMASGDGFTVEFQIFASAADGDQRFERAATLLGEVLTPFGAGLAVGSGTRAGYGRLAVKRNGVHRLERLGLGANGLAWTDAPELLKLIQDRVFGSTALQERCWTFRLDSDGDYCSIDSSDDTKPKRNGEAQIKLAKDGDAPRLTGYTVLGALRSRAAWLVEMDWLRNNGQSRFVPSDRNREDSGADDRFQDFDIHSSPDGLSALSSVERLFGVSGWAGLLSVNSLKNISAGETKERVNIAIDRLSGGALNGALFHTEVSRRPSWLLTLSIEKAGRRQYWTSEMQEADGELLRRLFYDIAINGIALGHGASKGLGWIAVEEVERQHA